MEKASFQLKITEKTTKATNNLPPHSLGGGASVDVGGGAGRGGTVALALLGSRWGRATDALVRCPLAAQGKGGGGSAALAGASVDL